MIDPKASVDSNWSCIASNLKELVTPQQYKTWFQTMRLDSFDADEFTFTVASKFLCEWIAKYYLDVLKQSVDRAIGGNGEITIKIEPRKADEDENTATAQPVAAAKPQPLLLKELKTGPKEMNGFYVNPKYCFTNYVVGPCNQLSYAASLAVSEKLSHAYNPLFIHGASGLGKTHLLQSICNKLLARDVPPKILHLSCETFINHFISSVEKGDLDNFRTRYRHIDILLIDDIHLLANKERTQEEFFHTFNSLFNSGKQIVITSDSYPSEIPTLQERLVSRFKWGLVTQIYTPDFETRCAILSMKSKEKGHDLPDEVITYLSENIDTNIRELEGAITKVIGYATLMNCKLDLEMAHEAMKDVIKTKDTTITIDNIVKVTTENYNVKLSDLQSKKRTQSIAVPRQIAMYVAKKLTNHSLQEIGAYFGGRDHSTVLHAFHKVDALREEDATFKKNVDNLIVKITR